ncbi:DUF1985 domain-containing protein [Candidatus Gracilibacteria bacterium]|nr:DUF1985 domain-containing protein [Candidatus Gracilibacteria bacterium]MCF7819583.1 DUF1985 domain-containing protein [Candidatus Gracilibacteria bacterium]
MFAVLFIFGVLLLIDQISLSEAEYPKKLDDFIDHPWMIEVFDSLEVNPDFQQKHGQSYGPLYRYFFVPDSGNKYRGEVAFSVFTDSLENIHMISIWALSAQDWREPFWHEDAQEKRYLFLAFLREVAGLNPAYLGGETYDAMLDRIDEEIHVSRAVRDSVQNKKDSPHNIIVRRGSVSTSWDSDKSSFILHAFTETREDIIIKNSQSYIDIYYQP